MSKAALTNPIFSNEDKAREHLEAIRWPNGPYCPHCGEADGANLKRLEGKSHRPGLFQCNSCRQHFTVTVGSVFERSKIPLTKWMLGFHLMASSKRGISAHQLHRQLGITYKTAWFMAHRIREAMTDPNRGPLGGGGKVIEADETYYGNSKRAKSYKKGHRHKRSVVALVEPHGKARVFHEEEAIFSSAIVSDDARRISSSTIKAAIRSAESKRRSHSRKVSSTNWRYSRIHASET